MMEPMELMDIEENQVHHHNQPHFSCKLHLNVFSCLHEQANLVQEARRGYLESLDGTDQKGQMGIMESLDNLVFREKRETADCLDLVESADDL